MTQQFDVHTSGDETENNAISLPIKGAVPVILTMSKDGTVKADPELLRITEPTTVMITFEDQNFQITDVKVHTVDGGEGTRETYTVFPQVGVLNCSGINYYVLYSTYYSDLYKGQPRNYDIYYVRKGSGEMASIAEFVTDPQIENDPT